MLRGVFRALRPGGRFVLRNLCPERSPDWLYYGNFPEAEAADLRDFWPVEAIVAVMEGAGFHPVMAIYDDLHFEQCLPGWLEIVRRRETCSQLQSISDAAYHRGVERLARDVADSAVSRRRADHLVLVTIRGDKRA